MEKLSEIKKMDLIYEGSILTIIAAAGRDANYGLPGSSGPRFNDTQSKVVVGNKKLISSFANPTIAIRESIWMSCGWTLQEALFSKRRLYISDDQVYFECDGMGCQESISLPLEDLPRDLFSRKLFATEPAKGVFSIGTENAFLDSVALYSARNLSYASVGLDAFRGVLGAFEAAEPLLYHFWCLPTWPSAERVSPERYFGRSLLWEFSTNVTRRRDFLSWSWLGWTGQARFPESFNTEGRQKETYFGDRDGGESITPRKAL